MKDSKTIWKSSIPKKIIHISPPPVKVHDYIPSDGTKATEIETTNPTQPTSGVDDTPADVIMDTAEPQPSTSTTDVDGIEKDVATEAEWQKPISLKALKKKLNELFVAK